MNIGYVCCDFGIPVFGHKGASVHVREMVAALRRNGHAVHIVSPAIDRNVRDTGQFFGDTTDPGIHLLPLDAAPHHLEAAIELKRVDALFEMQTRVRQEVRNLYYNLTLYDRALAYFRDQGIDLIYERYTLFAYAGIRIARELSVPHLLEVNAPLAYEQEKMRGMEMRNLAMATEQRIYRETDRVLVVSETLRQIALSYGVPDDRITVIPNAVDPQRFEGAMNQGSRFRSKYDLDGKCVIGFVGSLKPWHGIESLVQAFARQRGDNDRCHLLIVGDGPMREQLETMVAQLDLQHQVTFTGKVDYHDIPGCIAAMDITVAPYSPSENFYYSPIKVFEYMIMGKPVVASAIGQIEEIITDGTTGRLFDPGDVDEMSRILGELIKNKESREQLGKNARASVRQKRTWDANAKIVSDIAGSLIAQSHKVLA